MSAHCNGEAIPIRKHFQEVHLLCKILGVPQDPGVDLFEGCLMQAETGALLYHSQEFERCPEDYNIKQSQSRFYQNEDMNQYFEFGGEE